MNTVTTVSVLLIGCLGFLMVSILIGGIIYQCSKGKYFAHLYHDKLNWHIAKYDLNGRANVSYCAICGKLIVRTEDGPWMATK